MCSTTRWQSPTASERQISARHGRWPRARVPEGPIPALQDDPRCPGAGAVREAAGIPDALADGQPDPGLLNEAGRRGGDRRGLPQRVGGTAISSVRPIPRAYEARASTVNSKETINDGDNHGWNPARRVHRRAARRLRRREAVDEGPAQAGEGGVVARAAAARSRRISRRRRGRSSASRRSSRASTKRCAASTATASPASSRKASR